MSSTKVITVSPDLINTFGHFKTEKKRVKNNKTLKLRQNNQMLQNIRHVQSKLYNDLKNESTANTAFLKTTPSESVELVQPSSKFNECRDFLQRKLDSPTPPLPSQPINYGNKVPPFTYASVSPPPFGCLRNGSLPTYRSWKQQQATFLPPPQQQQLKQQYFPAPQQQQYISASQLPQPQPQIQELKFVEPAPAVPVPTQEKSMIQEAHQYQKKRKEEQEQEQEKEEKEKNTPKRKTTKRRIFHIGKDKNQSKVGVLISNTHLRNTVKIKCNELKTKPMTDVRTDLVKKGLIKIGSSAPQDVLRKIFEASALVCGKIQNHNNDTLLHNFIST
jgi:hypothetical protein